MNTPSTTEWLSVAQAAGRLGVGPAATRSLIERGELPALRVGRAYRIDAAEVAAYIATHTTGPATVVGAPSVATA